MGGHALARLVGLLGIPSTTRTLSEPIATTKSLRKFDATFNIQQYTTLKSMNELVKCSGLRAPFVKCFYLCHSSASERIIPSGVCLRITFKFRGKTLGRLHTNGAQLGFTVAALATVHSPTAKQTCGKGHGVSQLHAVVFHVHSVDLSKHRVPSRVYVPLAVADERRSRVYHGLYMIINPSLQSFLLFHHVHFIRAISSALYSSLQIHLHDEQTVFHETHVHPRIPFITKAASSFAPTLPHNRALTFTFAISTSRINLSSDAR